MFLRAIQIKVEEVMPGKTVSEVFRKNERIDKVLIDPSTMKRMGLVRPHTSKDRSRITATSPREIESI